MSQFEPLHYLTIVHRLTILHSLRSAIDQIESWLMSNTNDLSPTARGYISKVVNPKKTKDGGAPPILFK